MDENDKNKKDEQTQAAVNKGVIYGVAVTLTYLAYNYLVNDDTNFGVVRYLLIFAGSSLIITLLLLQFQKSKGE